MTSFIKIIAIMLSCAASMTHAETPDLTGDIWSVCGWDGQSTWDETRLVFTRQKNTKTETTLEGHFDWRSDEGSAGREFFEGTLQSNGALSLQGVDMKAGENLVMSRYRATLTDDGGTLRGGVWLDGLPGIWAAVRDGGAGTATPFCQATNVTS